MSKQDDALTIRPPTAEEIEARSFTPGTAAHYITFFEPGFSAKAILGHRGDYEAAWDGCLRVKGEADASFVDGAWLHLESASSVLARHHALTERAGAAAGAGPGMGESMSTQWIKCTDRLPNHPEEEATVLAWNGERVVIAGYYADTGWVVGDDSDMYTTNENITHWMPLPGGPGGAEGGIV